MNFKDITTKARCPYTLGWNWRQRTCRRRSEGVTDLPSVSDSGRYSGLWGWGYAPSANVALPIPKTAERMPLPFLCMAPACGADYKARLDLVRTAGALGGLGRMV